jgi:hypothetical protein
MAWNRQQSNWRHFQGNAEALMRLYFGFVVWSAKQLPLVGCL